MSDDKVKEALKAIERIQKLVELSGSSNENEARNAAVQACKLLRQHKIEMYPAGLVQPADLGQVAAQNVGLNTFRNAADLLRDVLGTSRSVAKDFKSTRETVEDIFRKGKEVPLSRPGDDAPVRVKAKHPGKCYDCGEPYEQGEELWFRRGVGVVHAFRCRPEVLV